MVIDKLKELEAARAKLAALEEQVAKERSEELAELPAKYGFASAGAFVAAVQSATGGSASGPRRGRRRRKAPARAGKRAGRRKRARITDETRAEVKRLVNDGKTGAEIAKTIGISLPSVQNIKKALGLVQEQ